jgi:hypothetical protein
VWAAAAAAHAEVIALFVLKTAQLSAIDGHQHDGHGLSPSRTLSERRWR